MTLVLDPRSWIADRLSRYFLAVDDQDLDETLAVLDGVHLDHRGKNLTAGARRDFYAASYSRGIVTSHQLTNLSVTPHADAWGYRGSYLRFEFVDSVPILERIGSCSGEFDPAQEHGWTRHTVASVGPLPGEDAR